MKLAAGKMSVATLSGSMSKDQRKLTLSKFKRGEFRALIVSGVSQHFCFAQKMTSKHCTADYAIILAS